MTSARLTSDREQIHDVLLRYCRGVDRLDAELIRGAYWPDAWDDHGVFAGVRDDFVAWVTGFLRAHFTSQSHMIANHLVDVHGDQAFSECYFQAHATLLKSELPHVRRSIGRYIDVFERRGEEWRIARRTVVSDLVTVDPAASLAAGAGCRDETDPLYRLRAEYDGARGKTSGP